MKLSIILWVLIAPLLVSFSTVKSKADFAPLPDPESFPIPKGIPGLLFYIQRDPNTNTICYEINTDKNGQLESNNPVHAFWIRYPEGGVRKDLNYIQRKFAYGINVKAMGDEKYELKSVAYSKLPLILKKDAKNNYRVFTDINKKECVLNRVFIRIDGGTFWSPNILYIELKGTDTVTGKIISQRIKPS